MLIDRKQLPESADVLQQMVLDLIAQLDASKARAALRRRTCYGSYSPPEAVAAASRLPKRSWRCSKPN